MKRAWFISLLLMICSFIGAENSTPEIRFDLDLKKLTMEEEPLTDQVILTGMITDRSLLINDPDSYSAELTLTDSEWANQNEIRTFQVKILLQGKQFLNSVPEKPTRRPKPEELKINTKILVWGIPQSRRNDIWIVKAIAVRTLPY